ncbi:unnamed protein product [Hermetia illucens]|uniref:Uncharacterized protein n=1 Tax=Hermetia illucens TaxID=343691 RepID=A0A7R8YQC0_HERIL|nr:uncharacterized protein LOC119648855 [Hermetia illucens]CAD7080325.1 unnamed protein product [Hermetia illucens]
MAQGKMKTKAKLPANVKNKKKGAAFTRRSNAPIKPKKAKFQEAQKIKQAITNMVNKSVEDEIRSVAVDTKGNLSKAQEAVAQQNKAKSDTASTCSSLK